MEPVPSRKYFRSIWQLRYDEVPDYLKITYLEQIIMIMSTYVTWTDKCEEAKRLWSNLHTTIERDRRNKKK